MTGRWHWRAPILRPSSPSDTKVAAAYAAWADHHNGDCGRCAAQSWSDPDRDALCTEGRRRMAAWNRAIAAAPVAARPEESDDAD